MGAPVKAAKKRARQKHTATALTAAKRRAEALRLREQGLSFQEIADRLGLAVSTVFETIQVGFRELREQAAESAEQIVSTEITRLDKMLAYLWPSIENGSTRAISTALKISERRMKILGLEREKLEMSGPGGGPIEVDSSAYERIKAKLAKYRENLAE